jgi:AcrR family transcriptional regulator
MAVFAEHGIASARLEEIAAKAGVSKGTIYLYFPSKEELFREVVRQRVVPRIAEADAIPDEGSAIEQLERYLAHQWETLSLEGSEGWVRLVLLELHRFPDLAEFYREEVINRSNRVLGDIVRRGVDRGEFRAVDPPAACTMIKSIILMNVLWSGLHSPAPVLRATSRAQTLRDMNDFIVHALRANTGKKPAAGFGAPTP